MKSEIKQTNEFIRDTIYSIGDDGEEGITDFIYLKKMFYYFQQIITPKIQR